MRSGTEALEILARERVDVLLVDYSMPGMNGVQLLENAEKVAPDAVSIVVTGYPELGDVSEARHRGLVKHLLAKPWRTQELLSAVEHALKMRAMRKAVDTLKTPKEQR